MKLSDIFETDALSVEQVQNDIMKMLKSDRNIWHALYHIDQWGLTFKKLPQLKEFIDTNKNAILYGMLEQVGYKNDWSMVEINLPRLIKMGVDDWSELDIIKDAYQRHKAPS